LINIKVDILTEIIHPVLPLRDIVIFPHMIAPLFVGRIKSINALESVMENNKEIILLTQKKSSVEDPGQKDLYKTGTIGNILQLLKLPDGTVKVLVEGKSRCIIDKIISSDSYLSAKARLINDTKNEKESSSHDISRLSDSFERFVKLNGKINSDILSTISEITNPSVLTDTIINHILLSIEEKQSFLDIVEPWQRVEKLIAKIDSEISVLDSEKKVRSIINHILLGIEEKQSFLDIVEPWQRVEKLIAKIDSEISVLDSEKKVRSRVKKQMEKTQREYYLNEQLKAIQKELGSSEDGKSEFDELEDKINKGNLTKEAKEKANSELKKLKNMSPMSAEATVVRSYIEWLTSIPWKKASKIKSDIVAAREILDADHYRVVNINSMEKS